MERALIVRKEWLDLIFSGQKTWEMRSARTNIRGKIGLIEAGSGMIVGETEIIDCFSNCFSLAELLEHKDKHCVSEVDLLQKWPIAWVLRRSFRWSHPKPVKVPKGAMIWVKLVDN